MCVFREDGFLSYKLDRTLPKLHCIAGMTRPKHSPLPILLLTASLQNALSLSKNPSLSAMGMLCTLHNAIHHTNTTLTPHKHCTNTTQTLHKHCTNTSQTLYKHHTNTRLSDLLSGSYDHLPQDYNLYQRHLHHDPPMYYRHREK